MGAIVQVGSTTSGHPRGGLTAVDAVQAKRASARAVERRRRTGRSTLLIRRPIGFGVAFGLTLLLALDGGGYDVVIRHQVGIAIWAAIGLGLLTGVLPRSRPSGAAWLAVGGLAALAVLTAISHAWTESDEATTVELARVIQYLGVVTLAYLALNRVTWTGAAFGFATGALVVPFFAVGARLFPGVFVDEVAQAFGFDRLSYPLDYWNAVACWGAMAIAIALSASGHAPRRLRAVGLATVPVAVLSVYLTFSRFGVPAVLIAVVASIALSRNRWTVAINAVFAATASAVVILIAHGQDQIEQATGSAGAWIVVLALLAAALVCGGFAYLSTRADEFELPRARTRAALAASAVALVLAVIALHGPISRAWDQFRHDRGVPTGTTERFTSLGGDRYAYWTGAYHAFESHPAGGIGPGSFETYWSRHGTNTQLIRNPHSLYLEQLSGLGVQGLLAVVAALAGLVWAATVARRRWTRESELAVGTGLFAAFVVFLVYAAVDWMWEMGAVGALALGGVAAIGSAGLAPAHPRAVAAWIRAGIALAAFVAAASQVPTLVSVERTRASDDALDRGDLPQAARLADEAIRAEPWASSPYAQRAVVAEAERNLSQARHYAQEGIERGPNDWQPVLVLARIDARARDASAVQADIRRARQLAPRSPYLVPGSPFLQRLAAAVSG
jgi:hypothetical protein